MLDHSNQTEDDFYNKGESSFVRNLLLSLLGNLSGSNLLFLTYVSTITVLLPSERVKVIET